MNKEREKKFLSIAILFLLFLFAASFPFSSFIPSKTLVYYLQGGIRFLYVGVFLFLIKKWNLAPLHFRFSFPKDLLFLPFFLLSGSNLFYLVVSQKPWTTFSFDSLLGAELFYSLCVALSEECLFRGLLLGSLLESKKPLVAVLFSSLIFSLTHAVNFFSLSVGETFAQMGYTLVLGLFLGILYDESENLVYPILLHALFNFLDNYLFVTLYQGEWDLPFFLTNGILGAVLLLYAFLLFFFLEKKKRLLRSS
jgi:membrane protease YdiL (CAAX protease family)